MPDNVATLLGMRFFIFYSASCNNDVIHFLRNEGENCVYDSRNNGCIESIPTLCSVSTSRIREEKQNVYSERNG